MAGDQGHLIRCARNLVREEVMNAVGRQLLLGLIEVSQYLLTLAPSKYLVGRDFERGICSHIVE